MRLVMFLLITIIILNPYTIIGPLAYFFIFPFVGFCIIKYGKYFHKNTIFFSVVMVFISLIGVISSLAHGIGQIEHLKVSVSFLIYIIVGFGFYFVFNNYNKRFDDFLYIALLAVALNGFIIILEVLFPVLRDFFEYFLIPSGNVDWTIGFRYRGIASGGGASLAVLNAMAVLFALYLYGEKYFGIFSLSFLIAILFFSLFFIGRTGLILLPLVFFSYVLFYFKKYFLKLLFSATVFLLLAVFSFDYLKEFVISQYGLGFYNYAFGFLLEGTSGFENEGTVSMIQEFLTIVPTTFPEVIIGYGFYGGSDFYPWTDSGYSRMFLSVGYLFGLIFYFCFFALSYRAVKFKPFLFGTAILVLLVAEAKEPLLFSGYASRVVVLLLAFATLEYKYLKPRVGI